jgi:hypothetical protein
VSSRHPSFQCSRRSRPRYRVVLLILIHLPPRCNTVKNQPKPSSRRGERSPSFLSPDLDTLALFLPVRSSRSRVLIVFIVLPGISNAVDASWTSPTPFSCTIRRFWRVTSHIQRMIVTTLSSKVRIPVMSYASCVVIALPRAARAMSDLLQFGSCPVGLP